MKNHRRGFQFGLLIIFLTASLLLMWLERAFQQEGGWRPYALVEKGLYVGGSVSTPPPGTSAVLNLCDVKDPYRCPVHAWEPIRDAAPAPGLKWLRKQVEFIADQRKAGRTTYVHCRQGISRACMVTTAYLMYEHRWDRDKALRFLRSRREGARPNPAFMELLRDWENELKENKP